MRIFRGVVVFVMFVSFPQILVLLYGGLVSGMISSIYNLCKGLSFRNSENYRTSDTETCDLKDLSTHMILSGSTLLVVFLDLTLIPTTILCIGISVGGFLYLSHILESTQHFLRSIRKREEEEEEYGQVEEEDEEESFARRLEKRRIDRRDLNKIRITSGIYYTCCQTCCCCVCFLVIFIVAYCLYSFLGCGYPTSSWGKFRPLSDPMIPGCGFGSLGDFLKECKSMDIYNVTDTLDMLEEYNENSNTMVWIIVGLIASPVIPLVIVVFGALFLYIEQACHTKRMNKNMMYD